MPDNVIKGNTPSDDRPLASPSVDAVDNKPGAASAYGSDLEDLIREAESQGKAPASLSIKSTPCVHSFDPATHLTCLTCKHTFCTLDASVLDPRYCRLCLPVDPAPLTESPLIDVDGIKHEGRVLTPSNASPFFTPRFGTLAKNISEMSMVELEKYIDEYKELVRQAERALDFRRVVLGASQLEAAQRKDQERRHLQADKTKYPIKTVSFDKSTGKQVTKTASSANMLKMLQALEALAKLKEKKKV